MKDPYLNSCGKITLQPKDYRYIIKKMIYKIHILPIGNCVLIIKKTVCKLIQWQQQSLIIK